VQLGWGQRWTDRFWGEKVIGQGHEETNYGEKLDSELNVLKTAGGNFTKFTTLVHLGTDMNWLDFEVKRSSLGLSETTCGQISILGGISSRISGMHRHILMKLITFIHHQAPGSEMTYYVSVGHNILLTQLIRYRSIWHWWHFQGHGFKG